MCTIIVFFLLTAPVDEALSCARYIYSPTAELAIKYAHLPYCEICFSFRTPGVLI